MNPWLIVLLGLLVLVVVAWVAFWVVGQMGLPAPINMVAKVIVGVILLIVLFGLLSQTGMFTGAFGGVPVVAEKFGGIHPMLA